MYTNGFSALKQDLSIVCLTVLSESDPFTSLFCHIVVRDNLWVINRGSTVVGICMLSLGPKRFSSDGKVKGVNINIYI